LTPVTTPACETVALFGSLVDHVIVRPVRTFPPASLSVAVNVVVEPLGIEVLAGEIVTVATGTTVAAVTVIADVPVLPSLVAVIVAPPAATPVTTPLDETVATLAVLVVHVMVRPVRMLPAASLRVAVSPCVCPWTTLADAGLTVTDATGASDTVTVAVPLLPSLVAVIVALPGTRPAVTSPVDETLAVAELFELQATVRSVTVSPFWSLTVADNWVVCNVKSDDDAGVTVTDPTGTGVTVTVAVPLFPSLVAVIVAVPAATPVTTPLADTVATVVALELHVTVRPVSTLPFASFVVALNGCVAPAAIVAVAGLTATVATGTPVTVIAAVPLFPSLVAVMVAVTGDAPLTTPLDDTVATEGALELHVTVRPVRTTPFASFVVAVSVVDVNATMVALAGLTVTVLTGAGVTVTVALPLFVSLVAVIVAVPGATPVRTPVAETVATAELLELHATWRSVTTVPLTSLTVTLRLPLVVAGMVSVAGETVTVPTGIGVTVTDAVPVFPSLVAVIVALPAPTAVTTPLDDTVATALLLVVHVIVRPVRTTLFASRVVADNVVVCPTTSAAVEGCTVTVATGLGSTVTLVEPVLPSLVAVIVTVPRPRPFTTPVLVTVAIAGLLDVQSTGRSFAGAPLTSVSVAES